MAFPKAVMPKVPEMKIPTAVSVPKTPAPVSFTGFSKMFKGK